MFGTMFFYFFSNEPSVYPQKYSYYINKVKITKQSHKVKLPSVGVLLPTNSGINLRALKKSIEREKKIINYYIVDDLLLFFI